jgi:hypothetical protein
MAAIATPGDTSTLGIDRNELPRYHFVDADGNHCVLCQAADGSAGGNLKAIELCQGGQQGGPGIKLTQQNVSDLLAALTAFASTGTLA